MTAATDPTTPAPRHVVCYDAEGTGYARHRYGPGDACKRCKAPRRGKPVPPAAVDPDLAPSFDNQADPNVERALKHGWARTGTPRSPEDAITDALARYLISLTVYGGSPAERTGARDRLLAAGIFPRLPVDVSPRIEGEQINQHGGTDHVDAQRGPREESGLHRGGVREEPRADAPQGSATALTDAARQAAADRGGDVLRPVAEGQQVLEPTITGSVEVGRTPHGIVTAGFETRNRQEDGACNTSSADPTTTGPTSGELTSTGAAGGVQSRPGADEGPNLHRSGSSARPVIRAHGALPRASEGSRPRTSGPDVEDAPAPQDSSATNEIPASVAGSLASQGSTSLPAAASPSAVPHGVQAAALPAPVPSAATPAGGAGASPRVRVPVYVPPDLPHVYPDAYIEPGEYEATWNKFGAVSVVTERGEIGVKPDEFVWVNGRPDPVAFAPCRMCGGSGKADAETVRRAHDADGEKCQNCEGLGGWDIYEPREAGKPEKAPPLAVQAIIFEASSLAKSPAAATIAAGATSAARAQEVREPTHNAKPGPARHEQAQGHDPASSWTGPVPAGAPEKCRIDSGSLTEAGSEGSRVRVPGSGSGEPKGPGGPPDRATAESVAGAPSTSTRSDVLAILEDGFAALETRAEPQPVARIADDVQAERVIACLLDREAQIHRIEAQAAAMIAELRRDQRGLAWTFGLALEDWMRARRRGRAKSVKTLAGTIGTHAAGGKPRMTDARAAEAWALAQPDPEMFGRYGFHLDAKAILAYVEKSGEVVPGTEPTEKREDIYVASDGARVNLSRLRAPAALPLGPSEPEEE